MQKQIERTIDSREVAEMVEKEHSKLLRDIRGYIEQLGQAKIGQSDFFTEATYKNSQNKTMPCYNVTKKGCEFIAHKLTGTKGTEFTARYINRFHDMEETIREGISQKHDKQPKKIPLASVNKAVSNIDRIFSRAGVNELYIAAETKRLYSEAGYEIKIPLITDKETMPKLYDCTEIARELGLYSSGGNPHNLAVSAIIKQLHIAASEIVTTAFSRNGHDDVTVQYKPSVFEEIKLWLAENGYPTKITYTDSKGNAKTCTVVYREVA